MALRLLLFLRLPNRTWPMHQYRAPYSSHTAPLPQGSAPCFSLYLDRAKIIDQIRLLLRTTSPNAFPSSLSSLAPHIDTTIAVHALRSSPSPSATLSLFHFLHNLPHFSHSPNTCRAALSSLLYTTVHHPQLSPSSSSATPYTAFSLLIDRINSSQFPGVSLSFMDHLRFLCAANDLPRALQLFSHTARHNPSSANPQNPILKPLQNSSSPQTLNLKSKKVHLCTEAYNLMMELFARNGRHDESTRLFLYMLNKGNLPNSRTYTVIIRHMVDMGKAKEGFEVFKRLPGMRVKRTRLQYTLLIQAFSQLGDSDMVLVLVRDMQKDGVLPMRSSVQALRKVGLKKEAEEMVKDFFTLDSRIGSIQGSSLCTSFFDDDQEGDVDDDGDGDNDDDDDDDNGLDGNDELVSLKPWVDPYAIASCLRDWDHAEVSALGKANIVWTARLVGKVLRGFKRADSAWEFFCWVAYQPGFTHDVFNISRMAVLLARQGHTELVNRLLSKVVEKEGIQISFSTIRLIIDAFGISKNADAALKVFRDFSSNSLGYSENHNLLMLYSSLLRTFIKCKKGAKATELLEEMMLSGIQPDIPMLLGLLEHFAMEGDLKRVEQLFGMARQCVIEPDAYMYKILIHAYCKRERSALAMRVFEVMQNAGFMPDVATKNVLVNSLWKEGKRREAASIEERIGSDDDSLPKVILGHPWTVSGEDLMYVHDIYAKCFTRSEAEEDIQLSG
ncbi:pentatricopeptide repeat-containing protein At5g66631 [Amborella trichopoda]|nr:pentatricopeptide repeat-containing protein At5g66631 [Amborella trichopoda]XP_020528318.1 pentatricopeptide repeat-containing protein At5g66631 [Amborella trichopoda]|eukprot:XP_020528317.1 pentatricopeptide repeat-containing protein At5g66631 [Amborella trichopoda]